MQNPRLNVSSVVISTVIPLKPRKSFSHKFLHCKVLCKLSATQISNENISYSPGTMTGLKITTTQKLKPKVPTSAKVRPKFVEPVSIHENECPHFRHDLCAVLDFLSPRPTDAAGLVRSPMYGLWKPNFVCMGGG